MNSLILIRILLALGTLIIIMMLFKLHKAINSERRIARYSLKLDTLEELSYFDKLLEKYHQLVKKCQNNKRLMKYSKSYEKYTKVGDNLGAIQFVINKLIVAFLFVILIIISNTIQGKIISLFGLIFSLIIGYYIYDIYLIFSEKRRTKKIKNDMLRAVIIMNNAFKAGKSTLQAVHIASHDLPYPIAQEFEKIYQDMSYGLSVDVAFQRFAKRVKLEEANYIASSLTILNKTGGNIVNVFSSIEKTLFDKKKLESDLKNSSAASNLVVKVLMVIPILFILVIYVMSPTYFEPLFASALGYMVIFIIIIMFIIYIYLLNKIMKVRV
ncbi:MAG: type II secretion system F family protein [Bacilli bacterium]|nr:type II secretion system F family protein [Bacilli bacterium]